MFILKIAIGVCLGVFLFIATSAALTAYTVARHGDEMAARMNQLADDIRDGNY